MQRIFPVNTTGRTKAQIVAEAEATWLLPHLLGELPCGESCLCVKCYHKGAYAGMKEMLAKVSRDLKGGNDDSEAAAAGGADCDVVQADAWADEARVLG